MDRIAPRFARYEALRHAGELMAGMVSGLDRKNCWTIAEHRGAATPDGLQHLLARASWDADDVRDDLRDYVVDAFGDRGAILVVDETGDVKKGLKCRDRHFSPFDEPTVMPTSTTMPQAGVACLRHWVARSELVEECQ